jgi:hypothetical protein
MMQSGLRCMAACLGVPSDTQKTAVKFTLEPSLALECRSRPTQSQQYLMSYIRHIYYRESNRRQPGLYDEMRT